MDRLTALLETIHARGLAHGRFRGLCHLAVGRRITTISGDLVSPGVTWRELSVLLRDLRFDKNLVTEVGADPDDLAPRDRQRFWYSAIALAHPNSPEARIEADDLALSIAELGYVVGPPPAPPTKSLSSPPPTEADVEDTPPPKRGRKKS